MNLTVTHVPVKHRAVFNSDLPREYLHPPLHLHFDITQMKTRFTRQPLVTNVALVDLTVACVPVKYRAAFNLKSFLHENVCILPFVENHNVFHHFERERPCAIRAKPTHNLSHKDWKELENKQTNAHAKLYKFFESLHRLLG